MADAGRGLAKFQQRLIDYEDLKAFAEKAVEFGSIDNAIDEAKRRLKDSEDAATVANAKLVALLTKIKDAGVEASAIRINAAKVLSDAKVEADEIVFQANAKAGQIVRDGEMKAEKADAAADMARRTAGDLAQANLRAVQDQTDAAKAALDTVNAQIVKAKATLASMTNDIAVLRDKFEIKG